MMDTPQFTTQSDDRALIASLAADGAGMIDRLLALDVELAEARASCASYRELLQLALGQLADLTRTNRRLQDQLVASTAEVRRISSRWITDAEALHVEDVDDRTEARRLGAA